jgi:glycosyltransferase involved in cell wall biosynthesis
MRVLVVSNDICRPDTASGDLRFSKILKMLAQVATVDLLIPQPKPPHGDLEVRYWANLETLGIRFVNPLFYRRLQLVLTARRYDWVLAEFWHEAAKIIPAILAIQSAQSDLRFAVDTVDVHFLRELAGLEFDCSATEEQRGQVLHRKSLELSTYRSADLVFVVTEEDRLSLVQELGATNMLTVPNIVEMRERSFAARGDQILFVGGFRHRPNVDAIHWFVDEVFPIIRQHCPEARLDVVGSHPPEDVLLLAQRPGIQVIGFVEDTTPWLQAAAVSVAPLRYGAGMKGKVTEALSAGCPVVTTAVGAQGLGAVTGVHLWIADDGVEFANAVVACLNDKPGSEMVAKRGQELIQKLCGEETVRQRLQKGLAAGLDQKKVPGLMVFLRRLKARLKCQLIVIRSNLHHWRKRLQQNVDRVRS